MMDIKPIKTQAEYRAVLKEIEPLMSARINTPEGKQLEMLVTLEETYERKHYPMEMLAPLKGSICC